MTKYVNSGFASDIPVRVYTPIKSTKMKLIPTTQRSVLQTLLINIWLTLQVKRSRPNFSNRSKCHKLHTYLEKKQQFLQVTVNYFVKLYELCLDLQTYWL